MSNYPEEELNGQIRELEEKLAKAVEALKELTRIASIAMCAEGDTFGIEHNNANDAIGVAEVLINELEKSK